jgi:MSHA pilin protein MshC
MTMIPFSYKTNRQHGFTLIELVMVIVILGILSAVVYERWPVGMEEAAAAKEFKRAVRYAQHKAMTRQFTTAVAAWGIEVDNTHFSYTVKRAGAGGEPAEATYFNRCLTTDAQPSPNCNIPLAGPSVWFNGLGEPLDSTGAPLTSINPRTYTIGSGTNKLYLTLCPATGYLKEGNACP